SGFIFKVVCGGNAYGLAVWQAFGVNITGGIKRHHIPVGRGGKLAYHSNREVFLENFLREMKRIGDGLLRCNLKWYLHCIQRINIQVPYFSFCVEDKVVIIGCPAEVWI